MPNQTISLEFSAEKTKALKYFLSKEGKTIETELQIHLEKLYQKTLSKDMREYLDAVENEQSGQTTTSSPTPQTEATATAAAVVEQSDPPERTSRSAPRRQREQAEATPADQPTMTMSM